jgi:hypothetical protein
VKRTFSALRAFCAYPEKVRRPSARRDDAADLGTMFHGYVEDWARCLREGRAFRADDAPDTVRGWLERMQKVWTPPANLEMEVAMGLEAGPAPRYVPVDEPAPHVYVPAELGVTTEMWAHAGDEQRRQWQSGLLTAGRSDLLAPLGEVLLVDDIKTNNNYLGDPKLLRQLLAQGIAATLRADAAGFIPGIYYARLGIFDRGDGDPIWRGSDEWDLAWDTVVAAAKMPDEPQPGPWCLSCYEKRACGSYPGQEGA